MSFEPLTPVILGLLSAGWPEVSNQGVVDVGVAAGVGAGGASAGAGGGGGAVGGGVASSGGGIAAGGGVADSGVFNNCSVIRLPCSSMCISVVSS